MRGQPHGAGRGVRVVDASRPLEVRDALAAALAGGAPVLPRSGPDASGRDSDLRLDAGWPEDACLVVETSGSTAAPKRVVLTASAIRASAAATARLGGGASDEPADGGAFGGAQWMLCLPAEYVAGAQVLARSILAGTEPVIATPGRFDPVRFAADVGRMHAGPRRTSIVPAQLGRLLDAAEGIGGASGDDAARVREAVASFDAVLVGGQSTPVPQRERAARLGWRLVTTYGASETAGGCVYNGVPLDGVEARIVDGEVRLAGTVLAAGYLGDPERTANMFVRDVDGRRWYRTGDAGTVDGIAGDITPAAAAPARQTAREPADATRARPAAATQRLSITGRLDNVIISGGEKVLLDRVERLVREVPGYEDAVVVGVPSREWGDVPAIVVPGVTTASGDGGAGAVAGANPSAAATTPPAAADSADALAADPHWARVREAAAEAGRAARPAHRIRVDAVPRLVSGKPDRREIAEIARRAVEGAGTGNP
ncbi:MAG: AMP-binding protein [Pseudoclavibacter sp.]